MTVTQPRPSRLRRARGLVVAAEILVVAVIAAVVVVLATTGGHRSATRPFDTPHSVWNTPVPADAPLAPRSSAYVYELQRQIHDHGATINTTQYGIPIYTVGPNQPRVPVKLDQSGPGSVGALAKAFAAGVPIPARAKAATGTDESLVVWQPSTDTEWEFWQAKDTNGTWHAYWGGKMTGVSHNPGYFDNPHDWGGSASSLSLLGGEMSAQELRTGHIDHALAMAIPLAAQGRYVYPAQRSDGHDPNPNQIPEGTRFRLNPHLNIAALHLPRVAEAMAKAAQRFGIIVRDQGGSAAFYAQDPVTLGHDVYGGPGGLFQGMAGWQVIQHFPWNQLQVVSPSWNKP